MSGDIDPATKEGIEQWASLVLVVCLAILLPVELRDDYGFSVLWSAVVGGGGSWVFVETLRRACHRWLPAEQESSH